MSYQKLIIVGNLGRDPEMRYMSDGTPVTSFSVATNRKWTGQDGSPVEETTWFRVSAWNKTAEIAAKYLTKGRQVMVEGTLTPDKTTGAPRLWTGQDGVAHASFEVKADRVVLLGTRADAGAPAEDVAAEPAADYQADEDIPF